MENAYVKELIFFVMLDQIMKFVYYQGIVGEQIKAPQVVVPALGQENAITFVVQTYNADEVSSVCNSMSNAMRIFNHLPACLAHGGEAARIPCSNCKSHHKILCKPGMSFNHFQWTTKVKSVIVSFSFYEEIQLINFITAHLM